MTRRKGQLSKLPMHYEKCCYVDPEFETTCNRNGATFVIRYGYVCVDHGLAILYQRATDPRRRVKRSESDCYSAAFGTGRPAMV